MEKEKEEKARRKELDASVVVGFHHLFPNTLLFHGSGTHIVMGLNAEGLSLYALSHKKSLWTVLASL